MNKKTKSYIVSFLCFFVIFIVIRTILSELQLAEGIWLPIVSALITSFIAPQFKVFRIDGKDIIYVAWIFSKKGRALPWL
ncbi:hypothetical protein AB4865_10175 [Capnocytophaga sp. ARDL2]|uniref:hypothetical protein n=1 Tax=Capnocytophaga sp. ARDL2 TaxID=3238809 RepID=UPI00355704A0